MPGAALAGSALAAPPRATPAGSSRRPIPDINYYYYAVVVSVGVGAGVLFTGLAAVFLATLLVDFLTADFFRGVFFDGLTGDDSFAASARLSAHRFFSAATIAALPTLLSFRFGFPASGPTGSAAVSGCFRDSAHLFRCASAIRRRTAADIFRLVGFGSALAVGAEVVPFSIPRSSAICASMRSF
jgi:hypothetical protein